MVSLSRGLVHAVKASDWPPGAANLLRSGAGRSSHSVLGQWLALRLFASCRRHQCRPLLRQQPAAAARLCAVAGMGLSSTAQSCLISALRSPPAALCARSAQQPPPHPAPAATAGGARARHHGAAREGPHLRPQLPAERLCGPAAPPGTAPTGKTGRAGRGGAGRGGAGRGGAGRGGAGRGGAGRGGAGRG